MSIPRFVVWMFPIGIMVLGAGITSGQDYPNKPIRIVAAAAGGSGDFSARLIAQGLSGGLGQQVIVENRGGSGIIPAQVLAKAPPDGYTLLLYGSSLWLLPFLQDDVSYDPVRDFSPITLTSRAPCILVVHPSVPVKSVKELIALAKARPGELNYASGQTGASSHLAGELFKAMAGVNIVRIAYKGGSPALIDLIAGQVQLMFPTAASVASHLKSGRLKALAVTTAQQSVLAPGLPTVAATVPGYQAASFLGIFVRAKTPEAIINRLNQEIVRVISQPVVKEKFLASGAEPVGNSPGEFAAIVRSEMSSLGKLLKGAGIRAN